MAAERFVGIDVSQVSLEVAVRPTGEHWAVPHTQAGIGLLVQRLRALRPRPRLIVLEATGDLEVAVAAALAEAGLAIAVVNPRQVRDFARATGKLAKTDRLDAQVLAHFADGVRPEPRPLPDQARRAMSALVARRQQLLTMRVSEQLRRRTTPVTLRAQLDEHIAQLGRWVKEVEAELVRAVRASPVWRAQEQLLRSAPGVGPILAATLVAELPELGRLDCKRIAALVGVAPVNRDSGTQAGRRTIVGGRATVRKVLYMGTVTASQVNPVIRAHYERLLAAGKLRKVALVACMRKLLLILNAMTRSQQAWQPPLLT